ncbi:acidic tetraheme cytochrome c3 TmcA [Desulfosarcina ovata]|uniref:Cytochrome c n=2 Tax=Desulfosarcina ovata TaxID=83564 RepID=A0A5K8ABJ5_9BACT|nr:cytochrome c3 family protein [Desulfosarcina ovata]BBO83625.1 cytochrome c [Desulfosarcina ovata subsp. sediminis]BBO90083.1 cytochrome c [Desulfosarcina ovata subsp. ovata]
MKTIALIALSLIIGTLSAFTLAWAQDDMTAVDNSDFINPQRSPSIFEHDLHNENAGIDDCAVCHHIYEDGQLVEGESSEDQRCSECHDLEGSDDQPALMQAFHANCKGCHQEQEAGPILCGECHVK